MAEQTTTDPDDFTPPASEETPATTPETPAAEAGETAAPETPEATETTPADPEETAPEADDATPPPADPEPAAPLPEATQETHQAAQATLTRLQEQQSALDAELDQLDKDIKDGVIDAMEAGPKVQLLTARQTRLERQINVATNAVTQQERAITQQKAKAVESQWSALGKKYADVAETPEKATETIKTIWDEEYAKAVQALPGAHPERIAGKAEAAWENRIALLRAQKGTAKPGTKPAPKPPGRLTPSGGTAPTSPGKESGAVVAERTLGPLSSYKF